MKCPICGSNIPEGKMYCEGCGAELQIVPDLEIDVEEEMKKTMSEIVNNEFAKDYDIDFDEDPNLISMILERTKSGKAFYVVLGVIIAIIIAAAIFLGKKISMQNSYEYQIEFAQEKVNDNDLLSAISALQTAYKLKPSSELLFTIADYYYSLGRDNDAIATLSDIYGGNFPTKDKENAYRKVFALYSASENYEEVSNILSSCTDSVILEEYSDFLVLTPVFSLDEGTYEETKTLKISAEGGLGKIYYTVDGSVPTTESDVFYTPVSLEYGSYTISAMYVNKYGITSEVVKKKYLIDVPFTFEPTILTDSGEYDEPTYIECEVPIMYTLYYTMDGTDPDKNSKRYHSPILMPAGTTTFKFMSYASDGTQSSIVERIYTYYADPVYTPAEAVAALSNYLVSNGYYYDGSTKIGVSGMALLYYRDLFTLSDYGNCYFVHEYIRDEAGNETPTGVIYAVSGDDLSVYVVDYSSDEYVLSRF